MAMTDQTNKDDLVKLDIQELTPELIAEFFTPYEKTRQDVLAKREKRKEQNRKRRAEEQKLKVEREKLKVEKEKRKVEQEKLRAAKKPEEKQISVSAAASSASKQRVRIPLLPGGQKNWRRICRMDIAERHKFNRFKFCPRCSNLIVLNDNSDSATYSLTCATCPYSEPITKKIVYTKTIRNKDLDSDIVDASKNDDHRQRTEVVCPECSHTEAFFYQMQTRSADEPMTNFYECANKKCKKNWRD